MNKGAIIAIVVAVLLLIGGGIFAFIKLKQPGKQAKASPTPKPKLTLPVNQIPVSERPYVTIEPTAAREVVVTIGELKKAAESVDLEIQYSAGEKEEAAIGSLDFDSGKSLHTKTILLGSQSGGGKITYHEGITGGTIALTFYNQNYKLSNEWAYIDNRKPLTGFSSRDAKFQITTANLFKGSAYVIVYQNPGLPSEAKKTLLAGPYSVTGTTQVPTGKVDVSLRLAEEKVAEIQVWDGKAWKSYATTMDGKTAKATVDYGVSYIAVEK